MRSYILRHWNRVLFDILEMSLGSFRATLSIIKMWISSPFLLLSLSLLHPRRCASTVPFAQIGSRIEGVLDGDSIGSYKSIDNSGDMNFIVVGLMNGRTEVHVFEFVSTDWVLRGNPIPKVSGVSIWGASVAISNDGNRVIVGALVESVCIYETLIGLVQFLKIFIYMCVCVFFTETK